MAEVAFTIPIRTQPEPRPAPSIRAAVDVSVVVVTWNSADWIARCVEALPRASSRHYEVLIFDNLSADATAARLQTLDPAKVRIEIAKKNHGFAGGVNRAIERATGRYILLLNPDCSMQPGSIDELVGYLDSNPQVAAAVPLLIGPDGAPQRDFQLRKLPSLGPIAADLLLLDKILPSNAVSAEFRYRNLDIASPQAIEQPAGAAMMIRREVVREIGPFDEAFAPAWFEDVDYCRRLSERGLPIHLVPTALADHQGGVSLEHVGFTTFADVWYRNLFRYASKWFRPGQVEMVRWLVIAGMLLRMGALAARVAHPPVPREEAYRAYRTVLRQAFRRWDDESPSS
jgi:N-acetylglucosaminyl-diphospho-decaprenol L-rhamnosyltransferase